MKNENFSGSDRQKSIFLTTYKLNNSIDRRLLVRLPTLDYQSNIISLRDGSECTIQIKQDKAISVTIWFFTANLELWLERFG